MTPVLLTVLPELKSKYLNETDVYVWESKFMQDETLAIFLTDEAKQPLVTASVNLRSYGYTPAEGNIFIKSYQECEGLYEGLKAAGLVSEAVRTVSFGYGEAVEVTVLHR